MYDIPVFINLMTDILAQGDKGEDFAWQWHQGDAQFYVLYKGKSYKVSVEPN